MAKKKCIKVMMGKTKKNGLEDLGADAGRTVRWTSQK
jgi:hypothetical protein